MTVVLATLYGQTHQIWFIIGVAMYIIHSVARLLYIEWLAACIDVFAWTLASALKSRNGAPSRVKSRFDNT